MTEQPISSVSSPPVKPKRYPAVRKAIGICAMFYGFLFVFIVGGVVLGLISGEEDAGSGWVLLSMVAWPPTLRLAHRYCGVAWDACFRVRPVTVPVTLSLMLVCVGINPLCAELGKLVPFPAFWLETAEEALGDAPIRIQWAGILLTMVVVLPIAEEALFRGWMLRGFLHHYSTPKAVVATAILFSVFHLNPWQALAVFPLGLFLAWAGVRTGSVVPCIFGHAAYNATGGLALPAILAEQGWTAKDLLTGVPLPPILLIAGAFVAAAGMFALFVSMGVARARDETDALLRPSSSGGEAATEGDEQADRPA